MAYFTTYKSNTGYYLGEVGPLIITGVGLVTLLYLTGRNSSNIRDLDTELTFHRHRQTNREHTDVAVNSSLEPLYLSGAWF